MKSTPTAAPAATPPQEGEHTNKLAGAEPWFYNMPGAMPRIAVQTGADQDDLLHGALCLVDGAMASFSQDDATPRQWIAIAALGLAHAFIAEAIGGNHG